MICIRNYFEKNTDAILSLHQQQALQASSDFLKASRWGFKAVVSGSECMAWLLPTISPIYTLFWTVSQSLLDSLKEQT
jgi:hypothetical protein